MDKIPADIKAALPGIAVGAWQALRSNGALWWRAASGGLCATVVLAAAPWADAQPYAPPWAVLVVIGAFAVPLLDLGIETIKTFPLRDLLVEFVRRRITRVPPSSGGDDPPPSNPR
jgi:hypothetical protein